MPDFERVDHDPFPPTTPVENDPFVLAQTMTHYADQPNPAKPFVDALGRFGVGVADSLMAGPRFMGDVMEGRLDLNDPAQASEAAARSFEAAASLGGPGALSAERGALGAFGGKPITAYHGSPYDFERFDISKVGTGEGAQAYGHGLYFAENENVAKQYRGSASDQAAVGNIAKRYLEFANGNFDSAIISAQNQYALQKGIENRTRWGDVVKRLRAAKASGDMGISGRMYKVSINADPEHFLDWDKPLSEQSEKVKNAASKVWGVPVEDMHDQLFVRNVPQETMAKLREAGVPGIKYLDQGSRSSGVGTHNFVVFDDKLIDILKKYGIAGIGALPAMGAYHFQHEPVDHDPFKQ